MAKASLLILGGRIIDPSQNRDSLGDLLIEGGKIAALEAPGKIPRERATQVLDAKGAWIVPGLIDVHVHLAHDNLFFLFHFFVRQRGVLHDIAENVDGDFASRVRHVDVKDGAVEGRVGVHITARFLDLLIDAAAGPRSGAFEEHMLEHMRHARAQPFTFVNTPGHAPGLR